MAALVTVGGQFDVGHPGGGIDREAGEIRKRDGRAVVGEFMERGQRAAGTVMPPSPLP